MNTTMTIIENFIEIQYRKLLNNIDTEYECLYENIPNERLKIIFSTLHSNFISLFDSMNSRLPTQEMGNHYWANPSRELINAIDIVNQLQQELSNTFLSFELDKYYKELFKHCEGFLCQYGGSTIPTNMPKVKLYYTMPIFIFDNKDMVLEASKIQVIDRDYIKSLADRATLDIKNGSFDSAITKSRTLLEEVFCYVIESSNQVPSSSGDIGELYKQVKTLYNMHQEKDVDKRINMLLSGLEKIITSISQMRNNNSDSHGVGSKRIAIAEHHARLFLNSSIMMSEFILSVAKNNNKVEVSV